MFTKSVEAKEFAVEIHDGRIERFEKLTVRELCDIANVLDGRGISRLLGDVEVAVFLPPAAADEVDEARRIIAEQSSMTDTFQSNREAQWAKIREMERAA